MRAEFRPKLQKLKYLDFAGHDRHDWLTPELTDEDLARELAKSRPADRFLGRYSVEEIRAALERYGVAAELARMGFDRLEVEVRTDEVFTHRLYIYSGQRDYDHILIELRLREGMFRPRRQFVPGMEVPSMSMILVDWLLLQNPHRDFSPDRPVLPQQVHPGLGLLQSLIPMVMEVVRDTGRGGVLDVPEHYHGALFYSRWFRFYNPEMEGKFLAMQRDLGAYPLHVITWAVFDDCLVNLGTGQTEPWTPGEQILPLCDALREYFAHPGYQELRDRAFHGNRFELDLARYERKKKENEEMETPKVHVG